MDKSVFKLKKKKKPLLFQYSVSNHPLIEVNEYKYLGITLTNTLSWNTHIANVASSAFRKLCLLRHKLREAPPQVKLLAYNTLIRPKMEYACVVWDPHTKKNINSLEKIQRRAVRFIYSVYGRNVSVTKTMQNHGIVTLESRRKFLRLKFLYSLTNRRLGLDPSHFVTPLSTRRTCHSRALSLMPFFARTDLFKFSFFPRTVNDWNNTSVEDLLSVERLEPNV